MWQGIPSHYKVNITKESALSTEQRGILRFSIGYLVYDLCGYKRMRVANYSGISVITICVFQLF